jgi:hypothetical protein
MMRRVVIVVVVALVVLATDARCAWACSCALPSATPLEARDGGAAVFAGRVTNVSIPDPNSYTPFRSVAVTVAVNQVWKGDVGSTIVIGTSRDGASCGYTFVVGQEYLLYAFEYEDELVTGMCGRTRPLADTQDDAVLGEGRVPIAVPSSLTSPTPATTPQPTADAPPATSPASDWAALVAVAGISVLVVAFMSVALRRFFPR